MSWLSTTVLFFAFIDRDCSETQALLIIAHVMAHVDFFGHCRLFRETDPHMLHTTARHTQRLQSYRSEHGENCVDTLIEAALILGDYCGGSSDSGDPGQKPGDLIGFVAARSPALQDWERDVLLMLRREAQYFWPQMVSKISNEGYAMFWHTRIMRHVALKPAQSWELAALNAKLLMTRPPQLNPYGLGRRLYEGIYRQRGLRGGFDARDLLEDAGLIRNALTQDIAEDQQLGLYRDADSNPQQVAAEFGNLAR
jgi:stage V sporulation protein R